MPPASLTPGPRQRPVVAARTAVAAVAVEGLGLPGAGVARALGVEPVAIWRGLPRGLDPRRLARAAMK